MRVSDDDDSQTDGVEGDLCIGLSMKQLDLSHRQHRQHRTGVAKDYQCYCVPAIQGVTSES
jgi:hypothetical protein